jgi:hypothetical protein
MSRSAGASIGARRIEPSRGAATAPSADLAALARGGRINFFGFVLRLMARLPFLFIAGRMYGAEQLGRFAYAVLIVEFARSWRRWASSAASPSSWPRPTSRMSASCGTRCWSRRSGSAVAMALA